MDVDAGVVESIVVGVKEMSDMVDGSVGLRGGVPSRSLLVSYGRSAASRYWLVRSLFLVDYIFLLNAKWQWQGR
jgi:hypothetical protein